MLAKGGKLATYFYSVKTSFNALRKTPFFSRGLPFFLFVIGGSFVFREITQSRLQFAPVKGVSKEELEEMGLVKEKNVTLEEVYEEIKKLDIDNWENKRGPRPWEETQKTN